MPSEKLFSVLYWIMFCWKIRTKNIPEYVKVFQKNVNEEKSEEQIIINSL